MLILLCLPFVVGSNIVDHVCWGDWLFAELNMCFGIITGRKIDFCRTFMIKCDFALMIIKAPIRNCCCYDDRLIQKTMLKTVERTSVNNRLL